MFTKTKLFFQAKEKIWSTFIFPDEQVVVVFDKVDVVVFEQVT